MSQKLEVNQHFKIHSVFATYCFSQTYSHRFTSFTQTFWSTILNLIILAQANGWRTCRIAMGNICHDKTCIGGSFDTNVDVDYWCTCIHLQTIPVWMITWPPYTYACELISLANLTSMPMQPILHAHGYHLPHVTLTICTCFAPMVSPPFQLSFLFLFVISFYSFLE